MFADVPLIPQQASTHASAVDPLFYFILGVTFIAATLVGLVNFWFAVRYRRRSETERTQPTQGSLVLEIAWSVIPFVFMMIFFYWGAELYFSWARPPDNSMEVFVVAKQWMWKLQHLGGQREINELHVPVGRPVKLTMTSQDVIHSFFVPAFRVHMDVLPGRYTTLWFEPTKAGRYHLFCSQYCGTNHSKMIGEIVVMEPDDYQKWLTQGVDGGIATEGRKLFMKMQCVTCHSADAKARAPVLEEIFMKQVPLDNGRLVVADETYLRESILFPDAKIVAGFKPIMPSFRGQLDEEDIVRLIAFIKSLKAGETPRRTESADPPLRPVLEKQGGK